MRRLLRLTRTLNGRGAFEFGQRTATARDTRLREAEAPGEAGEAITATQSWQSKNEPTYTTGQE
eukprot:14092861-Alexandrium_andersonii.AAC.1